MTSLMNNNCKNVSHIVSIWNYASEYKKLVNEFIESDYYGMNILHFLAIDDNEEVIKLIFENVDSSKLSKIVNVSDKDGSTPLEYAVIYGHLALVKSFIGKGADFKVDDDPSLTLLDCSALHNRLEIVKYFIDNEYFQFDSTVLYYAIENNCLEVVRYFIEEKEIYINSKDREGKGYLHYAVEHSSLEIFEYLLEYGATVDLQDKNGMTPLHFAAIYGHSSTVRYLAMNNVNTNLEDISNNIPQNYDVKFHCYNSARCLFSLEEGANVKLGLKDDLYYYTTNYYPSSICCYQPQSTERHLKAFDEYTTKKRKLENISEALQFEDKSTVNLTSRENLYIFI